MTSLIDNNIDGLIKRVRESTAVSDIVFMAAYPPHALPNPISRYTAAVNNMSVKTSQVFIGDAVGDSLKGSLYDVDLIIRVYAPRNTSASALLRMTSLLYDALDASDIDGAIEEMSMGGIVYENTARTVYRDISVRLRWLLCGEGSR